MIKQIILLISAMFASGINCGLLGFLIGYPLPEHRTLNEKWRTGIYIFSMIVAIYIWTVIYYIQTSGWTQ